MGTATSVLGLKFIRLGLGLTEGPCPSGWPPPSITGFHRGEGDGHGVYIAATMFAPILVPPLAVWIAMTRGWRWVFFSFAIPGLVIAVLWYLLVRTRPSESAFVSKAELETITVGQETPDARRGKHRDFTGLCAP